MSTSQEFTDYALELLEPLGKEIEMKRMFGGVLLKVDDKQLGALIDDTIFMKVVDPKLQERFAQYGSKQFSYTRKDKKEPVTIKHWWSVPEYAMESSEALVELAQEVLAQTNL